MATKKTSILLSLFLGSALSVPAFANNDATCFMFKVEKEAQRKILDEYIENNFSFQNHMDLFTKKVRNSFLESTDLLKMLETLLDTYKSDNPLLWGEQISGLEIVMDESPQYAALKPQERELYNDLQAEANEIRKDARERYKPAHESFFRSVRDAVLDKYEITQENVVEFYSKELSVAMRTSNHPYFVILSEMDLKVAKFLNRIETVGSKPAPNW